MSKFMIQSQISHNKLCNGEFKINFKQLYDSITELIMDFLSIYHAFSHQPIPEIQVIESNPIPMWICADW